MRKDTDVKVDVSGSRRVGCQGVRPVGRLVCRPTTKGNSSTTVFLLDGKNGLRRKECGFGRGWLLSYKSLSILSGIHFSYQKGPRGYIWCPDSDFGWVLKCVMSHIPSPMNVFSNWEVLKTCLWHVSVSDRCWLLNIGYFIDFTYYIYHKL